MKVSSERLLRNSSEFGAAGYVRRQSLSAKASNVIDTQTHSARQASCREGTVRFKASGNVSDLAYGAECATTASPALAEASTRHLLVAVDDHDLNATSTRRRSKTRVVTPVPFSLVANSLYVQEACRRPPE